MAPVKQNARRQAPAQTRRNAAARPAPRAGRRVADEEPEEDQTAFDAKDSDDDEDEETEGELPEVIDLSDVEAVTSTLIPRGTYPATISDVEYGLSQSKGLPMLTWTLLVDYEEGKNPREMRYYTTLTGDGAGRTKAFLAKLDPDLDLSALRPEELGEHFADMEVTARITIRPDRDDRSIKRNNIADFWPSEEDGYED